MALMEEMDKRFESSISTLSDKEKKTAINIKSNMFKIYNSWIKPILIAVFMFWLFNRVKGFVGLQEAIFIQLTTIIIFLRMIAANNGAGKV